MSDVIAKALARLERDGTDAYVLDQHSDYDNAPAEITQPLAALIDKCITITGDGRSWCYLCGDTVHAPDCALIDLCKAITGDPDSQPGE